MTQEPGAGPTAAAIREFKRQHRKLRKNWDLPANFPSAEVVAAYVRARVDECRERFTMGRPDVAQLEAFCAKKFGWPAEQVQRELEPVLKARALGHCLLARLSHAPAMQMLRLPVGANAGRVRAQAFESRETQATMDTFLYSQRFAKIKSKRLQKAVANITGRAHPDLNLADELVQTAKRRKKAAAPEGGPPGAEADEAAAAQAGVQADVRGGAAGGRRGRGRGRRAGRGRQSAPRAGPVVVDSD